jgi:hypothetical protein
MRNPLQHVLILAALLAVACDVPDVPADVDTETGASTESGDGDGCDGPERPFSVNCTAAGCRAWWAASEESTPVYSADMILALPMVDPSVPWACEPEPDVELCVEVDSTGHIGCFRIREGWAVPVAPCCAIADLPGWLEVGLGVAARVD